MTNDAPGDEDSDSSSNPSEARTDLFLSLTPHKVIEAVEAAGVLCNRVCYPLNSFENRVYELEREDRSRVIAKFYRPGRWTRAQILEEHRFLADLDEAEIPVATTLPFPDGATLRQIDHIPYSLFRRVGGRAAADPGGGAGPRRLSVCPGGGRPAGAARSLYQPSESGNGLG